jgi:hypothetical protein
MSLWLYELLSPEILIRHISLFLLVIAIGMPTLGLLRWFALASGIAGIALALIATPPDRIGLFWMALFIVVNLVQMWFSRSRKFGRPLTAEEQRFHETVVPRLSASQVRRLLTAGRWYVGERGVRLTAQGEPTPGLVFLASGRVDVFVDGQKVAVVKPDSLIGEIGVSTGEPANATAIIAEPSRYLEFDAERLRHLLETHLDLLDAVELAIQRSLGDKLNRQNAAAAHPDQR